MHYHGFDGCFHAQSILQQINLVLYGDHEKSKCHAASGLRDWEDVNQPTWSVPKTSNLVSQDCDWGFVLDKLPYQQVISDLLLVCSHRKREVHLQFPQK